MLLLLLLLVLLLLMLLLLLLLRLVLLLLLLGVRSSATPSARTPNRISKTPSRSSLPSLSPARVLPPLPPPALSPSPPSPPSRRRTPRTCRGPAGSSTEGLSGCVRMVPRVHSGAPLTTFHPPITTEPPRRRARSVASTPSWYSELHMVGSFAKDFFCQRSGTLEAFGCLGFDSSV